MKNPHILIAPEIPTVTVNDIDVDLPDLDLAGLVFDPNPDQARKACMVWRSRHKRNEMFTDKNMRRTHIRAYEDEEVIDL